MKYKHFCAKVKASSVGTRPLRQFSLCGVVGRCYCFALPKDWGRPIVTEKDSPVTKSTAYIRTEAPGRKSSMSKENPEAPASITRVLARTKSQPASCERISRVGFLAFRIRNSSALSPDKARVAAGPMYKPLGHSGGCPQMKYANSMCVYGRDLVPTVQPFSLSTEAEEMPRRKTRPVGPSFTLPNLKSFRPGKTWPLTSIDRIDPKLARIVSITYHRPSAYSESSRVAT